MRNYFVLIILYLALRAVSANPKRQKYPGHAVKIQFMADNETLETDTQAIDDLFLHPDVKHRKVVAFSIAGAYRKGKSFFLGYCLRYLYSAYPSVNAKDGRFLRNDWNADPNEPLQGFSFKAGVKADTNGVLMWSDIFLYDAPDGDKIAIVLIDTQGLFEPNKPASENSRIFGLSNLIASVQAYNLMTVVQENELEYLEMTVAFANLVGSEIRSSSSKTKSFKPFQNLIFLIRDFVDENYERGYAGGEKYLTNDVLNPNKTAGNVAAQTVRLNIHNSFDRIQGFLMPHPGFAITKTAFNGSWKNLEQDFVNYLQWAVESIFAPKNLVKKKIFNKEVTGEEYHEYISAYFKAFKLDKVPDIPSILQMTIERQMAVLFDSLKEKYKTEIGERVDFRDDFLPEKIKWKHYEAKAIVMDIYDKTSKIGNDQKIAEYKKILEKVIEYEYENFKSLIMKIYQQYQYTKKVVKALKSNHNEELKEANENYQSELQKQFKNHLEEMKEQRRLALNAIEAQQRLTQNALNTANIAVNKNMYCIIVYCWSSGD